MQYRLIDFLAKKELYIHENAQTAPRYPLTLSNAKLFFDKFVRESFEFNGIVRSIFILSGKYYPEGTSWADGYLHSQSLDDIQSLPEHSEFAGHIYFQHRENDTPKITVD